MWLNAGYADVTGIDQVDAEFVDRMMNVNVRGPVLQLAKLSRHLNDGASVVLTSSTSTYEGAAMASVYAATKGALVAMARGWASALAGRAIRVNVLVPGAIDTNFRDFMADDVRTEFEEDVVSRVPLGRVGTPSEAAAVALFLLSDDSSYVTASQYAVDGGADQALDGMGGDRAGHPPYPPSRQTAQPDDVVRCRYFADAHPPLNWRKPFLLGKLATPLVPRFTCLMAV